MIQIAFERATLPLGPHTMMAYFPRGRKMLTTQAVVRHTRVPISAYLPRSLQIGMMTTVRGSSSKIEVPKIYGYKDLLPNDIGAEVVLMEKVVWTASSTVALLYRHPSLCTDTRRESSGRVAHPFAR